MRTLTAVTLILSILLTLVTGCGKRSTTVQAPVAAELPKAAKGNTLAGELPGDSAALKAALAQQSTVSFQIVTAGEAVSDKDSYLDNLLTQRKWPEDSMFVVVVFSKDNYDLRFAMGADFHKRNVSVAEMLDLVRGSYFPKARAGDPSGGLTDLLKAVRHRME